MNELELYKEKVFDDIKHIDKNGYEYWLARELQIALKYKEWRKFKGVVDKAKVSCEKGKLTLLCKQEDKRLVKWNIVY